MHHALTDFNHFCGAYRGLPRPRLECSAPGRVMSCVLHQLPVLPAVRCREVPQFLSSSYTPIDLLIPGMPACLFSVAVLCTQNSVRGPACTAWLSTPQTRYEATLSHTPFYVLSGQQTIRALDLAVQRGHPPSLELLTHQHDRDMTTCGACRMWVPPRHPTISSERCSAVFGIQQQTAGRSRQLCQLPPAAEQTGSQSPLRLQQTARQAPRSDYPLVLPFA